jgi:hypothetical protein
MENKHNFQKHDALSFNTTTLEQRIEIHKLLEHLGYKVAITTKKREKEPKRLLDCHFAFEFDNMCWRAISISQRGLIDKLNFKPYKWWYNTLMDIKITDNSDSIRDTKLDNQLKIFQNESI